MSGHPSSNEIAEIAAKLAASRLCVNLPGDVPLPICASCRRAIRDGSACLFCGRPHHRACLEDGTCAGCASRRRADERSRERAGRLLLRLSSPRGERLLFLFAPKILLAGRSQRTQGTFPLPPVLAAAPRGNDLVLRSMETFGGAPRVLEDESRLVSRSHVAFAVRNVAGREEFCAYDIGTEGKGSTCGTWRRDVRLPGGAEVALSDGDEIVLGRQGAASGVALSVHIVRRGERLEAVELRRRDALAGRHRYVVVVGTAPIRDDAGGVLGTVRVADGRFVWRTEGGVERPLAPGDVLDTRHGTLRAEAVDDTAFWSAT